MLNAPKRIRVPRTGGNLTHPDRYVRYTTDDNALALYDKHVVDNFYGCTPTAVKMMHEAAHAAGRF